MEQLKIMRKMKEMQKEIDSREFILFFSSVMLHFSHIHEIRKELCFTSVIYVSLHLVPKLLRLDSIHDQVKHYRLIYLYDFEL